MVLSALSGILGKTKNTFCNLWLVTQGRNPSIA